MSRRRWLCLATAPLLPLAPLAIPSAWAGESATETLERYGLAPLGTHVWVTDDEIRLRQKLSDLPKLKESIVTAERSLDERVEQNRQAWKDSQSVRGKLKQAIGKLSPSDPERQELEATIAELNRAASDPTRLPGRSDVRAQLVTLSHDRSTLAISLLWLRGAWQELQYRYHQLTSEPAVQRALASLGTEQRLGPTKSYESDIKRVRDYERLVFTAWLPIYLQSGQTRVTAIANEQVPITFTWRTSSDQKTVLTAGAAEALGIEMPTSAKRTKLSFGGGRTHEAREVCLTSLRFGKCVVRDVVAYVLPPEGEDLGPRIGRSALGQRAVKLDHEHWRMTVEA